MSAAPASLAESSAYFEVPRPIQVDEESMQELVHELRQPLSSIEAIAYYLEMTLPAEQFQARQYMRRLQQLVDQAEAVLARTASRARKPAALAKRVGSA